MRSNKRRPCIFTFLEFIYWCNTKTAAEPTLICYLPQNVILNLSRPSLGQGNRVSLRCRLHVPSSPDSGECGLFSSVEVRSGPNKCSLIVSLMTFWTILYCREKKIHQIFIYFVLRAINYGNRELVTKSTMETY